MWDENGTREPSVGARVTPPACRGSPVVGVVIAAHQAETYLGATLRSLRDQTLPDWECVVVDDGSTDATRGVAEAAAHADGRIRAVSQPNGGISVARNAGFSLLSPSTEYVCYLDSDDLLLPDALATLVGALSERPDAVGCSAWAELIDANGTPMLPGAQRRAQCTRRAYRGRHLAVLSPDEDTTFESLLVHSDIFPPATALLRCEAVRRAGGFDPALTSHEDWDLFLRVAKLGPLVFVDRQVAWYRRHQGNFTRDLPTSLRFAATVRRKMWDDSPEPSRRIMIVRANSRVLAWIVKRQCDLLPAELRGRRWSGVACGVAWTLYALVHLLRLKPAVPSARVASMIVRMEVRCRVEPGHPSYLELN